MSSALVDRPREHRTAPIAHSSGTPIATRTCEGSTFPDVQAEPEHDRLGLHVAEEEARRPREPVGAVAGEPHLGHPRAYAVPQPVAQRGDPLRLGVHVAGPYLDRLAEPDDAGHVLGP